MRWVFLASGMLGLCGLAAVLTCGAQIHDAVRDGNIDKINQILAADPSAINAGDKYGCTPLMYAVSWPRADIVELLLKKGAKVEARDHKGLSALDDARGRLNSFGPQYLRSQEEFMRQQGQSEEAIQAQIAKMKAILTPEAKEQTLKIIEILTAATRAERTRGE